mmetsp:Transcript_10799/g.27763  ORF Transcript_10799/g.27763 Transcript_10799/m.27763 type:complete len:162 (-) Transcript_10799:59-544(-)
MGSLELNVSSKLHTLRLPRRHGRPNALYCGTGLANGVTGVDARTGTDFGLLAIPNYQKRGMAMAKLDLALRRRPPGWKEPEKYVTGPQRHILAERQRAAERQAAEKQAAAAKAAADAVAAREAQEVAARKAAEEAQDYEAELAKARESIFSWSGEGSGEVA